MAPMISLAGLLVELRHCWKLRPQSVLYKVIRAGMYSHLRRMACPMFDIRVLHQILTFSCCWMGTALHGVRRCKPNDALPGGKNSIPTPNRLARSTALRSSAEGVASGDGNNGSSNPIQTTWRTKRAPSWPGPTDMATTGASTARSTRTVQTVPRKAKGPQHPSAVDRQMRSRAAGTGYRNQTLVAAMGACYLGSDLYDAVGPK